MDVLKRAADWFRAGGGNDQVLVRKPGGSTSGAAGRDRISGAGAGSRGQRIGSGQTCPVGHRARAVLAARCRRRSFSRCRFLRGCTAGLLALRCQTRLACQHGQVQDRSQELGAGRPLGVLQFPQGLAADLAAGGDSGCPRIHGRRRDHGRWREHRSRRGYRSRCDDGIRGSGGRGRGRRFGENNILESLPWTGRINRRCRACHWRNRRQRGRNHRLGGHRHRGGGRGRRRGIRDRGGHGRGWIGSRRCWIGRRSGHGRSWIGCRSGRSGIQNGFGNGWSGRGRRGGRCRRNSRSRRIGRQNGRGDRRLGRRHWSRGVRSCRVRGWFTVGGRNRNSCPGGFRGRGHGSDVSRRQNSPHRVRCDRRCFRGDRHDCGGRRRRGTGGLVSAGRCRRERQPGNSGDTAQNHPPECAARA